MTINERAADLRRAIDEYDTGNPPVNKAGALLPGAKAELVAIDPVIEAANALLEEIGGADVKPELTRFLDMVDQMDMGPLDHFTCTEATALAELVAADRGQLAGTWVIAHHIEEDEEEEDELEAHLEQWPLLRPILAQFSKIWEGDK